MLFLVTEEATCPAGTVYWEGHIDHRCWRLGTQLLTDTPFMLQEPAEQAHRNQEEILYSCSVWAVPSIHKAQLLPLWRRKKHFKELTSIFLEQALEGGFGTLRQYTGSWHK